MKINKEEIDLILNSMQETEIECQKIGSTVVGDDAEYLIAEEYLKFLSNNGTLIRLALEELKEKILDSKEEYSIVKKDDRLYICTLRKEEEDSIHEFLECFGYTWEIS